MRMFNPATEQYADVTDEAFGQVWAPLGWVSVGPVVDEATKDVPAKGAKAPARGTAEVTADNDGPVRAKAKDK